MTDAHAPAANATVNATINELLDRCLGAYLGLAIGDALGATVEFLTPREIAHRFAHEGGVHREIIGGGWLGLQAGQVTDDTTMSLALGDALLAGQRLGRRFDMRLVADAYVAWLRAGPVDCGSTCRRGIQRYMKDGSLCGEARDGDGGNGALMRNLPAVLATLGDDAAFEQVSIAQARITHHQAQSDAAVLGIGRLLRLQLAGAPAAQMHAAIDAWVTRYRDFTFHPFPGLASGYVVDTVQTVLYGFTQHADFEAVLVATVNLGDDADTTGALVGMLAGARCGARALPARWLARLNPGVRQAITDQTSALVAMALDRHPTNRPTHPPNPSDP